MRYSAIRDDNEAAIVDALRKCGATVQRLDAKGVPDLLVGYRNVNLLMEVKIKEERNRLTTRQKEWLSRWHGHWAVVTTPTEAMKILEGVAG